MNTEQFDHWYIIEIFGHQRIAGRVTEQAIGGVSFIRVDVPEVDGIPQHTRLYGGAAIYSLNPVAEVVARAAAKMFRSVPVSPYDFPALRSAEPPPRALSMQDDEDDSSF